MKNRNPSYIDPVDVHAALERAQADRAEYIRTTLVQLPARVKRAAARLRQRLAHTGAWA